MRAVRHSVTIDEIDRATCRAFQAEVDQAMATVSEEGDELTLDFTDVRFMDSTGIKVLIDAHAALAGQDRRLVIANRSPAIERVLHVTGLDEVLRG